MIIKHLPNCTNFRLLTPLPGVHSSEFRTSAAGTLPLPGGRPPSYRYLNKIENNLKKKQMNTSKLIREQQE